MDYRDIIFKPGAVARVILNRPKYHNAQPMRMVEEMDDAFRRALGDSETRVIVLSGAGPSFSAGHDLGTPEALADREARGYQQDIPSEYDRTREYWYEASMRWRNIPLPTIAMVHGYCIYGGWIFAASMDLVFASDDALFLPSHTQYFTAPWDIGPRRAKEILYEGRFITAQEAYDFGFVSRVFAAHELEKNTIDYANRVAQQTRFDLRQVKFSVNNCLDVQGFTAFSDSAYQTFYLRSVARKQDYSFVGPNGERRADGVAHAKDLLREGYPRRERGEDGAQ